MTGDSTDESVARAEHLNDLGERRDAVQTLCRARAAYPYSTIVAVSLAEQQHDLGDLLGAEHSARSAVAMAPGMWVTHVVLAQVLSATGKAKRERGIYP